MMMMMMMILSQMCILPLPIELYIINISFISNPHIIFLQIKASGVHYFKRRELQGIMQHFSHKFHSFRFHWIRHHKSKEIDPVTEMLHNTLKFPEFEVNLIWGFDMNDIHLMSNVTRSGRNEICERNVAYHLEVPWVWSSDAGSLDLEDSDMRIWYEWYIFDV